MSQLLKGKEVAASLNEQSKHRVEVLKEQGITPALAIVRVGNKDSDVSYCNGAIKRCAECGVESRLVELDENVTPAQFYSTLEELNADSSVHGILMLRPLPQSLDNEKARNSIAPCKDIDGCSDASLGGLFVDKTIGYAPCTAEAAMAILDHYQINVNGKNVVVLGRSLVIGKPIAATLLNRNATVTVCHSKSQNLPDICRKADILIVAIGKMEFVGKDFLREGQTVIDVGISFNEVKQKLCGDVLFEEADGLVEAITPVPGGVGAVTTAMLVSHVITAAEKQLTK